MAASVEERYGLPRSRGGSQPDLTLPGSPRYGMPLPPWQRKKTRLYSQLLSEVSLSLSQVNADEFNEAADQAALGMHEEVQALLTADIGGTNCRFSIWLADITEHVEYNEVFCKTYSTAAFASFEDAFTALTNEQEWSQHKPSSAALACAGPVVDNVCRMTNLTWVINGDVLTERFGLRVAVLNDFEACGYGIGCLEPGELLVLNDVDPHPKAPKAVMGPGTGLGMAQLIYDETFEGYRVWPSEGAHATFAPRGEQQRALHAQLEGQHGYCEVEHVACGSGLANIYEWMRGANPAKLPAEQLQTPRTAPEIGMAACDKPPDQLCHDAVDMFLRILGAEAGAMGLRLLASGGIYISGGIIPKLVAHVQKGGLLEAFEQKGSRFEGLVKTFPLYAVLNDRLGMLGTREYALRLLKVPENTKGFGGVIEAARRGNEFLRHHTL